MKKALFVLGLLLLVPVVLAGCGATSEETADSNECYAQCDEWGGGTETVAACKENCDASSDSNSVWNQTDEEVEDANDATFSSWDSMPTEVPEFTYGDFVTGEEGLGSWIVDYENVTSDALDGYTTDLEAAGWSASSMEVTGMITGSYDSYTISVSIDSEYGTAQIIVRK